jgi:hypothetical protein
MTTVNGKVLNYNTLEVVPGATVSLMFGNVVLKTVAARNDGTFSISTSSTPDSILISSVGYESRQFGFDEYSDFWTFFLYPSVKTESEVIVKATRSLIMLGLLAALLIMSQQKR